MSVLTLHKARTRQREATPPIASSHELEIPEIRAEAHDLLRCVIVNRMAKLVERYRAHDGMLHERLDVDSGKVQRALISRFKKLPKSDQLLLLLPELRSGKIAAADNRRSRFVFDTGLGNGIDSTRALDIASVKSLLADLTIRRTANGKGTTCNLLSIALSDGVSSAAKGSSYQDPHQSERPLLLLEADYASRPNVNDATLDAKILTVLQHSEITPTAKVRAAAFKEIEKSVAGGSSSKVRLLLSGSLALFATALAPIGVAMHSTSLVPYGILAGTVLAGAGVFLWRRASGILRGT